MKKIILLLVFSLSIFALFKDVQALDLGDTSVYTVTGVVDGEEYTEDIYIEIENEENGVSYLFDGVELTESLLFVDTIGYHTLELVELGETTQVINFTILPRFSKEIDGMSFENRITLRLLNEGTILVNNSIKENGIELTKVGYYNMEVQGTNGFVQEYSFEIYNSMLEFVNGMDYLYDVRFNTNAFYAVYIDNVKQYGIALFDSLGSYEVKVLGVNGYFKVYQFNIVLNNSYLIDGKTYDNYIKVDDMESTAVYVDGIELENSLTFVRTIGNHEIKYTGKNGYEEYYNVALSEGDLLLETTYIESFSLNFEGFTAELNGEEYLTDEVITAAGYYTLEVFGVNGYSNQYRFLITGKIDIVDEEETQISIQLDQDFKYIFVNGSRVSDYRITETGHYEILFMGEGGFTRTYTIDYVNNHVVLANEVTYFTFAFVGAIIITYALLAWRRFK